MSEDTRPVHVVIPDTQTKPGVPDAHLGWIGRYIVDHFAGRPNVKLIHLGDHWDMPSLSSYDKGKRSMEGRRVREDIDEGNRCFKILNQPLIDYNQRRIEGHRAQWWPAEAHFLMGNHEDRITRAVNDDAQLHGFLGLEQLDTMYWERHDFLDPVFIDGIGYAHYWANPMSGRPYGGTALHRLKTLGHTFTQGHQQTLDHAVRFVRSDQGESRSQHGLVAGACLTPDHQVLTADLRYIPLGDLKAGEKIVSFDETLTDSIGRSRRFKTGTVLATKTEPAPVFRVELSNGDIFHATEDHQWLAQTGSAPATWRQTWQMRKGTRVVKPLSCWSTLNSRDAGYLAGMYDGEGCYYTRKTTGGYAAQLGLSQKPGRVLDETLAALSDIVGYDGMTYTNQRGIASFRVKGGTSSIARVLGSVRPNRLLSKFQPEHLGRIATTEDDKPSVVSIEPAGVKDIVRVDVDAKTMIVDGYAHHNCYLHNEDYKGYQGNAHWRGIVVCHGVERGSYNPMFVDLDYLCLRYEGMTVANYLENIGYKEGLA